MIEHLTSIVAIDKLGAIGCKNRLPWSIKSDMAFFRRTTLGNTVIMGRKTYESVGGGKGLKGRKNIILSRNAVLFESSDQCALVNSVDEALATAFSDETLGTFIVGGAATYGEFAPLVDRYLVSFVEHIADDADTFLSRDILDELGSWPTEEIATYPAEAGQDDFPFRIVSFSAPDSLERREARKATANQFLGRRLNQTKKPNRIRSSSVKASQEAFLF